MYIIYTIGQCSKSFQEIILSGLKILLNSLKISKNYNEQKDEGYFLEIDVQYPEKLHQIYEE